MLPLILFTYSKIQIFLDGTTDRQMEGKSKLTVDLKIIGLKNTLVNVLNHIIPYVFCFSYAFFFFSQNT